MKRRSHSVERNLPLHRFAVLWLGILAALLAWKGWVYPETLGIRQYLGMAEPATATVWWIGAGCVALAAFAWLGCVLLRRRHVRGAGKAAARPAGVLKLHSNSRANSRVS